MEGIKYIETDEHGLDLIAPLWRKLNEHHKARSPHFKDYFDEMSWEKRKPGLLEKLENGAILVNIAKDRKNYIGYCVSTISENKVGEIESIFIEEEYRHHGIGDNFMKRALKWMDAHAVIRKTVAVAAGNEEAFGFYNRYGFYHRMSILLQAGVKQD